MGVRKAEAPKRQLGLQGHKEQRTPKTRPRGHQTSYKGPGDALPCHPAPLLVHTSCTAPRRPQAPHSRVPPEQHVPGEGCRDVSPAPAGALSLPGGAAGRTSRWGSPGARRGNPSRPGSAGWGRRGPEALWVGHRPDGPAGPAAEDGDVSAEPGSGQPCPAVMQDTAVILWGSQGTASTSSHWSPSDRN